MSSSIINARQLSHDLRSLIEPLETAAYMYKINKPEQAIRIQSSAIKALKKLLADIEVESAELYDEEQTNE